MRFGDIVAYSLKNLKQNRGRTIATMVGVVLGTLLVVLIVAIGNGANQSIMDSMQQNTNLMLIQAYPYYGDSSETENQGNKVTKITDSVIKQIRAIDGVEAVTPQVDAYFNMSTYLLNGDYKNYAQIIGVYMDDFAKIAKLSSGTYPNGKSSKMEFVMSPISMVEFQNPDEDYEWVDVYTLLENGEEIPLPNIKWLTSMFTLRLTYYDYSDSPDYSNPTKITFDFDAKMTGILQQDKNDYSFAYGTYVDIDWLKKFIKDNKSTFEDYGGTPDLSSYNQVYIKAATVDDVSTVLKGLNEMGVQYYSPMQWIDQLKESTNKTQMFLMFIAMFTMLASIMSIYNTISMSVQERKREIGIMKVLGCRISKIRMMFLTEAMMIGLGGGFVGLVLSYGLAQMINNVPAISKLLSQLMGSNVYGSSGLSAIISPSLALASWAGAVAVSVLSGYIPANRATRLSAQEAIRSVG